MKARKGSKVLKATKRRERWRSLMRSLSLAGYEPRWFLIDEETDGWFCCKQKPKTAPGDGFELVQGMFLPGTTRKGEYDSRYALRGNVLRPVYVEWAIEEKAPFVFFPKEMDTFRIARPEETE